MKQYLFIFLTLFAPIFLSAQELTGNESNTGNNNTSTGTGLSLETGVPGLFEPLDLHMQTGASFGTLGYGGSYFQSFLSPALSFPLNKKLSIAAGVTYSHTTFNDLPLLRSNGEFESFSGNMNTLTMHTAGIYRANDKMTFTGTAFSTINPSFNSRLNPETLRMEARGFSFGVDYKLGENTHIGAEVRFQQGNGNLYNPYNSFYSPYRHNSPFMNNYGFPSGF